MNENIQNAIIDLNEEQAIQLVQEKIKDGAESASILEKLGLGMEKVTERFEKGEYGLAELHMVTEIFNECVNLIELKLKDTSSKVRGKVIIGKVIGRREDFSREPVAGMLRATGFEVYDLGENISAKQFIDKAKEVDADIIGICGLESTSVDSAKKTISDIRASGIKVKILVGSGMLCGCQIVIDDKIRRTVGADAVWNGVREAIELAKKAVTKEE